jgi:hypothetical protein
MQPADGPDRGAAAPVIFSAPPDAWTVTADVVADGGSATTDVVRLYRRDVRVDDLADEGPGGPRWRLQVHRPDAPTPHGVGVLLVPGSTGLAAMAPTAGLLASHGHPTALLAYMQEPGLPTSMRGIPVEVVAEAFHAFARSGAADADRIVLWAVSVGTGLALSATERTAGPSTPTSSPAARPRGMAGASGPRGTRCRRSWRNAGPDGGAGHPVMCWPYPGRRPSCRLASWRQGRSGGPISTRWSRTAT